MGIIGRNNSCSGCLSRQLREEAYSINNFCGTGKCGDCMTLQQAKREGWGSSPYTHRACNLDICILDGTSLRSRNPNVIYMYGETGDGVEVTRSGSRA